MGNTLGGVNWVDPDKSQDLLGRSAPTFREYTCLEKISKLTYPQEVQIDILWLSVSKNIARIANAVQCHN